MSETFDYIIVGAGSAGCVLANRLSENAGNRVLLLESGPSDKNLFIQMPRGVVKLIAPGGRYVSTYEASKGDGYGAEPWVKGRVVGGSSSVNGMIYSRGHPQDFDDWEAMGCAGWGWKEIGAAYEAIEDHELGKGRYRGVGGPLHLTVHEKGNEICEAILAAAEQAGTPRVDDINDAYEGGFGYQIRNIWRGKRQSAATAFLDPVRSRKNLEIRTKTDAVKIEFEGNRAVGVLIRDKDGERVVRAKKDVILSAGAIETPRLLQLSGVGDAGRLRALGLPVVANAPEVGKNLQEHLYVQVQYRVTHGSVNDKLVGLPAIIEGLRYILFSAGVMTAAPHELSGFVKTRPELNRPDAHFGLGLYSMKFTDKGFAIDSEPGITFGVYQMRPESRGEMKLVSADPSVAPEINANYLAAERDRADAVSILRYIRKIVAQDALKPFVKGEISPGEALQGEDDIVRYFGENGYRGFHVSCTCRMGGDDRSVVDPQLRVRGVEGLRIVDTSIFPTLTSGNTNAPVMAVAWRAGDVIQQS